jgi:peptidoglycan/LPS O-acetylase OafA/YrhL
VRDDREVDRSENGWRSGRDPIQRWLRVITTLVVLAVFVYLVVSDNAGTRDLPTLALALGAVLVLLGYEGVVRLPFLSKDDRKDDDGNADGK